MSKHTPGPWAVFLPNAMTNSEIEVNTEDGEVLIYSAHMAPETHANARLIAAAPDLLAVAKRLLKEDDGGHGDLTIGLMEDAAAAIARVEREDE